MKTKWTKEIPKVSGWYWIKYKFVYRTTMCPALVEHQKGGKYIISTWHRGLVTNLTEQEIMWDGFRIGKEAVFGNKIASPRFSEI